MASKNNHTSRRELLEKSGAALVAAIAAPAPPAQTSAQLSPDIAPESGVPRSIIRVVTVNGTAHRVDKVPLTKAVIQRTALPLSAQS